MTVNNFDLDDMDTTTLSERGVAFQIMRLDRPSEPLRNRDGSAVTITVLGPDSAKYRHHQSLAVRKRVEEAAASGSGILTQDSDESLTQAITLMASITTEWTFKNAANEPIPCTHEAAVALYTQFPAIRDQIDQKVSRRSNFLRVSLTG
jgi:nucleoside 2-deoxyribosyltransferase